jgi:hypothetical protein
MIKKIGLVVALILLTASADAQLLRGARKATATGGSCTVNLALQFNSKCNLMTGGH